MLKQKTQTKRKPLDEKLKLLPIEQQNYIKGFIDGTLSSSKYSVGIKRLGGQAQ